MSYVKNFCNCVNICMKKYSRRQILEAIEYWQDQVDSKPISEADVNMVQSKFEEWLKLFEESNDECLHSQVFGMKKIIDEFNTIVDDIQDYLADGLDATDGIGRYEPEF